MPLRFDFPHICMAAATCVLLSLAGGLFQNLAALQWLAGLRRARWHIPSAAQFVVQALVYFVEAVILYRLLEVQAVPGLRVVALAAVLVLMVAAEGAMAALLGLRSPEAGMAAHLVLLAPLTVAEIALWYVDRVGASLLLPYGLWVVLYLAPWAVSLCRLNRTSGREAEQ